MLSSTATGRTRWDRWIVVVMTIGALALLIVPAALQLPVAVGHAQYHALFALVVLAPCCVIAWRGKRPTFASMAPILGLALFALAQLVEAVGGLGYDTNNQARVNSLANIHDVGLAVTPIGLLAAVLGLTVGMGVLAGRRTGRPLAGALLAVVILLAGGFAAAKLIGL